MSKRRRVSRGILGVPRQGQILFSFQTREGEEWPSEDDDSDFSPGYSDSDEERTKTPTVKKQRKQESSKTCKPDDSKSIIATRTTKGLKGVSDVSVPGLPPELWLKIFILVVQEEGALPTLPRLRKVCHMFAELVNRPELWRKVDMNSGLYQGWKKMNEARFKKFCEKSLTACHSLNVSGCPFMSKTWAVSALCQHVGVLRSLNLSNCSKLPAGSMETIVRACQHLRELDLSNTTPDSVSTKTISTISEQLGQNLTRLSLANNRLDGFSRIINILAQECPNLQHLDLSNCKAQNAINIEQLQSAFPKLQSLYLSNTLLGCSHSTREAIDASQGFPLLEELSLACQDTTLITETFVSRMLKCSPKLRLLDLRGCVKTNVVGCLKDIEADNVEQLFLGKSQASSCEELPHIIRKWRHSLTHLDLSGIVGQGRLIKLVDDSLRVLHARNTHTTLQHINLSGSNCSTTAIRELLTNCISIEDLNLTSCRELARGIKREYKNRREMSNLKKDLQKKS
ncbi:F-box/LRR-repeat protein 6-like isoform X2 [Mya arenaria]|uniref:F-box/LRR-repeat protein 6-like isoform X2 n=1 Tax=Mya arenaria TaxID=6604 RepID=UPI0022DEA930|nr:F-box/LRR-repeat protein 6-like isoform X2 [Mya arenaria]